MLEMTTKERRRTVKRMVTNHTRGLRLEQLANHLQQEVQTVRQEQPELSEYTLYDLTFSFEENGMLLNMDFRR